MNADTSRNNILSHKRRWSMLQGLHNYILIPLFPQGKLSAEEEFMHPEFMNRMWQIPAACFRGLIVLSVGVRRSPGWTAVLICAALLALQMPRQAPRVFAQETVTVLRGATVIDGTGAPARPNTTIVVRDDRIDAIGQGIAAPAGATVVDLTGKFITPGLWDKHLHYKSWFPEMLVTNGVTSGYVQEGAPWFIAQAEGIAKGKILGPRMFYRIRSIDFYGSPDEARKMVRDTIAEGASFIKMYTMATPEIVKVAAEEAHKAGLHVEGHFGIPARQAVMAGADGLVHGTGIELDTVKPEVLKDLPNWDVVDEGRGRVIFPKVATWDESKTNGPNPDLTEYWLWLEDPRRLKLFGMMDRPMAQDLIKLLVDHKVFIEGCMTYIFRNVNDRTDQYRKEDFELLNDPNLRYIPDLVKTNVLDYSLLDKVSPQDLELMKKGYRNYQWFIKTFVEAGGKIVMGPDTTSIYHATQLPGVSTRRELELMVDAGLTPMQAIMAATKWPAEYIGAKAKDLGTLEKGKLADLVVLPKNPLEDVTVFKHVERVMQAGRFLPVGYHYYYKNPIPWPPEEAIDFPGYPPASQTPELLTAISPPVVAEDGPSFTLTVKGREFLSTAVIQFGDQWLATERVSTSELRATVPAALVKQVGTYPVQVVHKAPGWGKTNTLYLIVKFK